MRVQISKVTHTHTHTQLMKNTHCAHGWGWVHNGARGQRLPQWFNRKAAWQHVGRPAEISQRKQFPCYSNPRSPCRPFCLFCSETCLDFVWLSSNYYCLWSTITTAPMLSLEVNESCDLTACVWTTLTGKLPEKIKVSGVWGRMWNKSPSQAPLLASRTAHGTLFSYRDRDGGGGGGAQLQNIHALMFTAQPERAAGLCHHFFFNKPLQKCCTHAKTKQAAHKQTHTIVPTCSPPQKWRHCRIVQVTSTCKYPPPVLCERNIRFEKEKKKMYFLSRCSNFSSQISCAEIKMELIHLCLCGSY